jgi:CubicO group peptidase (beta-lactamase class C family)
MEEIVFAPVGMTSSTLRPTMAMTRAFSQGHDIVKEKVEVLRPAPDKAANWPAGSLFSNLTDLSRFAIAMMGGGQIDGKQVVSPKVVTALTTPRADIPGSKAKYGYGLEFRRGRRDARVESWRVPSGVWFVHCDVAGAACGGDRAVQSNGRKFAEDARESHGDARRAAAGAHQCGGKYNPGGRVRQI